MWHNENTLKNNPLDGKKGPAEIAQCQHQVTPWELNFPLWHRKGTLHALSRLPFQCNSHQHQP